MSFAKWTVSIAIQNLCEYVTNDPNNNNNNHPQWCLTWWLVISVTLFICLSMPVVKLLPLNLKQRMKWYRNDLNLLSNNITCKRETETCSMFSTIELPISLLDGSWRIWVYFFWFLASQTWLDFRFR